MQFIKTPFADDGPKEQYIHMSGTQVFRFAVGAIGEAMDAVLQKTGLKADDVKYYVPHQANMRIIQAAAQRMKQPLDKFQINIQTTGNVSAASIPMALADLMKSGKVQPGDKIMMVGFGGGLSAGAVLFEA
jgi:3-oxoacyl-[acyl-carrier-protein] synthase-3